MCNSGRADRVPAAMLPVQLLPESPVRYDRVRYLLDTGRLLNKRTNGKRQFTIEDLRQLATQRQK